MDTASQGNVIGPSPGNPNSSSDIFKSSLKTTLFRYAKGIINRFPSKVYTLKCPFWATDDVLHALKSVRSSALGEEIFLAIAATFCHFLAILEMFMGADESLVYVKVVLVLAAKTMAAIHLYIGEKGYTYLH